MDELFNDDNPDQQEIADLFEQSSESAKSEGSNEEDDMFEENENYANQTQPEDSQFREINYEKFAIEQDSQYLKDESQGFEHTAFFGEKLNEFKERADKKKNKDLKIDKKKDSLKAFVLFSSILMRNPYHYQNFLKLYTISLVTRTYILTKLAQSKFLASLVLSKLPLYTVEEIEDIRAIYEADKKQNLKTCFLRLSTILMKNFKFNKFNESPLIFNLGENDSYTVDQIMQIFFSLCKYVGIPVRLVSAIDLRNMNIDKKHYFTQPGMKPLKREAVKRKKFEMKEDEKKLDLDDGPIIQEIKLVPKKAKKTLNKRNFGSMVSELTQGIMDSAKTTNRDFESTPYKYTDGEDSTSKDYNSQAFVPHLEMSLNFLGDEEEDKPILEIDSKLASFAFRANSVSVTKKAPPKTKMVKVKIENTNKKAKTAEKESNEDSNSKQAKATGMTIDKFSYGKKPEENRLFASDEIENPEQKLWLEVYDYEDETWYHVEPTKGRINENYAEIHKKLHGVPGLFIITFQKYEFAQEYLKDTIAKYKHYYLIDLTSKYIEKHHRMISSRRELRLDYWWYQIVTYFGFNPALSSEHWKKINMLENERQMERERSDIPSNPREFRASKYYILSSMLKKHQGFYPDAKPLEGKTFKDEAIFEKSAICNLHSKARWKREMRRVLPGQEPVKKVLSLAGQGETLVDLFGIWQTEEFVNELGPDGSLPKNEYGNYEIFNGELPKGVVHLNFNGIARIAKKLGIEYVEAIVDFEMAKNGRPHVVKGGIIAHERDERILREAYSQFREEIEKKEKEKMKNEVVGLWKGVK